MKGYIPGNLNNRVLVPIDSRREWRRLICVVLPERSKPSITTNGARFRRPIGEITRGSRVVGIIAVDLQSYQNIVLVSPCNVHGHVFVCFLNSVSSLV